MKIKEEDINHKYKKIIVNKYNDFLLIDTQDNIFDEFGNYKMPNYFEFTEINSAIPKHK